MRATFKGGYTLAFYKADVTTGDAQETWHNQPNDAIVANVGNVRTWRAICVIFQFGGGAADAAAEADAAARRRRPPKRPQRRRRPTGAGQWTNGIATTRSTSWIRRRVPCC